MQFPPAYSAIKRGGIPAYRAARAGDPLALDARLVVAHALRLVAHEGALLHIEVECGKGYYVRSLARDLGAALHLVGAGAALGQLPVHHAGHDVGAGGGRKADNDLDRF